MMKEQMHRVHGGEKKRQFKFNFLKEHDYEPRRQPAAKSDNIKIYTERLMRLNYNYVKNFSCVIEKFLFLLIIG